MNRCRYAQHRYALLPVGKSRHKLICGCGQFYGYVFDPKVLEEARRQIAKQGFYVPPQPGYGG